MKKTLKKLEDFPKCNLGGPMIDSSRLWFRQAMLVTEGKSCTPASIVKFIEKAGSESIIVWDLIWMALSNNSPLIKWYVTNCDINTNKTQEDLSIMIGDIVKNSTKKGGLQALCNTLKESPIGTGETPLVKLETKGKRVISLTRLARNVDPLVVLYGLFLICQKAEVSEFTVSQLMTADFDGKFVSPIVAFGMSVVEFKNACQGLMNKYPDFIHCSFNHGLEDIQIKTANKTIDDVVELMLK